MTTLLNDVPTPVIILLFALLIFTCLMGYGGPFQFRLHPRALFGNMRRSIFRYGGCDEFAQIQAKNSGIGNISGGSVGLFEQSSLPEDRLF